MIDEKIMVKIRGDMPPRGFRTIVDMDAEQMWAILDTLESLWKQNAELKAAHDMNLGVWLDQKKRMAKLEAVARAAEEVKAKYLHDVRQGPGLDSEIDRLINALAALKEEK